MKKVIRNIIIILSIIFVVSSCKKDNPIIPPIPEPEILKDIVTVSVESGTHRSVELNIHSTMNDSSLTIELYRTLNNTDTLISIYTITITDTTIIEDDNGAGLQLDTEYKYYAVTRDSTGETKDTSNTITVRTLAATSHNYTWQEYTFGDFQKFTL